MGSLKHSLMQLALGFAAAVAILCAGCEQSGGTATSGADDTPLPQAGSGHRAALPAGHPVVKPAGAPMAQCPYIPAAQPSGCGSCSTETAAATAATCPKEASNAACTQAGAAHADCSHCAAQAGTAAAPAAAVATPTGDQRIQGLPPVACSATAGCDMDQAGTTAAAAATAADAPTAVSEPVMQIEAIDGTGDKPSPCCATSATESKKPEVVLQAAPAINLVNDGCSSCDGR